MIHIVLYLRLFFITPMVLATENRCLWWIKWHNLLVFIIALYFSTIQCIARKKCLCWRIPFKQKLHFEILVFKAVFISVWSIYFCQLFMACTSHLWFDYFSHWLIKPFKSDYRGFEDYAMTIGLNEKKRLFLLLLLIFYYHYYYYFFLKIIIIIIIIIFWNFYYYGLQSGRSNLYSQT